MSKSRALKFALAFGFAVPFSFSNSVQAATVNLSGTFTAAGFLPFSGSDPAPFNPITGSFALQYDDTAPLGSFFIPLDFSLSIGSAVYDESNTQFGIFAGGGITIFAGAATAVAVGTNDFFVAIIASGGGSGDASYTLASFPLGGWYTLSTTVEYSAVPLPAALPLLAAGLGAMGFMGWRKKRKNFGTA